MLEMLNQGAKLGAMAREFGVSRQAIDQYMQWHKIDYTAIIRGRKAAKLAKIAESRKRICQICGEGYSLDKVGAGSLYCSRNCYNIKRNQICAVRNKIYYQTERGKLAHQTWFNNNREERNRYMRNWQKMHRESMTAEEAEAFKKDRATYARNWRRKQILKVKKGGQDKRE
jgi:hypothetical protein